MTNDVINQFIVSDSVDKGSVHALAKKALKHGRITQGGNIVIDNPHLSKEDTVKLALVIRFIANALDDSISQNVRPVELTSVLHERVESAGSRLSKLAKEGFAKKSGYGQYSVFPYKIDPFLDALSEAKDAGPKRSMPSKRSTSGPRKAKELTGIGLDIQKLIDEGFFATPRFVSEVDAELKKETRYHDPKVIDMTIRKTFVANRRSLKRIPNIGGGKAKWKYVIRN